MHNLLEDLVENAMENINKERALLTRLLYECNKLRY